MADSKATHRPRRLALIVTDVYAFNVLSRGQLEYLHEHGAQMDLYCGGDAAGIEKLRKRGVGRVFPVPFRRRMNPVMDLAALCVLVWHLLLRRYDSVVYSTPKAMFVGSLAAAITLQRKRICFVRGRAYENFTGTKRRVYEFMDRLTFAVSHTILFISKSQLERYVDDGLLSREKGVVLGMGSSNGVDVEKYRPLSPERRAELRAERGLTDDHFAVVIPGRIVADKGVNEAIDLIDRLADRTELRWFFIGWPEDEELIAKIRAREARGVQHFDHSDAIEEWLGMADLAYLPSHREGFGSVGIEAAACGLPVLAFDVVGLQDSVADGLSGKLVPMDDIGESERFVRDALEDRAVLRARFAGNREWAVANFANRTVWENYARAYLGEGWQMERPAGA